MACWLEVLVGDGAAAAAGEAHVCHLVAVDGSLLAEKLEVAGAVKQPLCWLRKVVLPFGVDIFTVAPED